MGNWKARGVGQMIVTVGCEDVTEDTSSSATTRRKGESDYVRHGLGGRQLTMRGVGVACTVGRHDMCGGGGLREEVWMGGGVDVTAGGMNTSATQGNDSARRDTVVGVGVVSSQSAKLRKQTWDVDDKKNGRRQYER